MAILGYGGGAGVLGADRCAEAGLQVEPLTRQVAETLSTLLPEIASTGNPVDMTPEAANQDRFRKNLPLVLDVVDGAESVEAVLLQGGALGDAGPEIASEMASFVGRSRKGVAVYWHLAPRSVEEVFRQSGVPVFTRQREAAQCLGLLPRRGVSPAVRTPEMTECGSLASAAPSDVGVFGEHVVHRMLATAGVDTLAGELAATRAEAVAWATQLARPVALKVVGAITHRAAAGLVSLGVGPETVGAEFDRLAAAAAGKGATVEGVFVQQMAAPGQEFIVSAFRDPAFGVVVTCGAGGVLAELIDDVTFSLAPVDPNGAAAMVQRLRMCRHLERTTPTFRRGPLADYLCSFSELAGGLPYERFVLELNPVIVTAHAAVAADGLLVVDQLHR